MHRLNKVAIYTQIVQKYYKDVPRLILTEKLYKWQKREINNKAVFPRNCLNFVLTPRYQEKRVGQLLAAPYLYLQGREASDSCNDKAKPPKDQKKKGITYYALGFMMVGAVAGIAYAESDPEFRDWLKVRVPITDEVIKVVYREEKSYKDSFEEYKGQIKALIVAKIQQMMSKGSTSSSTVKSEEQKVTKFQETVVEKYEYKPPVPAFTALQKEARAEEHYTERRLISEKSEIIPIDGSSGKASGDSAFSNLPETHPLNLLELEKRIGDSAEKAICVYNDSILAIREYSKELYQLIDQSFKKPDSEAWGKLKKKALEKQKLLNNAESEIKSAMNNISRLLVHLDNPDMEASYAIREKARKNIERIVQDIEEAKKKYEKEADALSVTQKFWKKVEDTRKFFNDDLMILFPKIRTRDKNLKMTDEEIELLLSHLYKTVLYYQKEFSKVDNVRTVTFKQTVDRLQSGKGDVTDAMVEAEMENLQRTLLLDNEKKELAVKSDAEKMSRVLLQRQKEAQKEYLKDVLAWKEVEVERRLMSSLDDKLDELKSDFKLKVAGMTGRMKGLNVDIKAAGAQKDNQQQKQAQAQVMWSACQALITSLNAATNNKPWTQQLQPLQAEISAIEKAADEKDDLVKAVIAAVPKKAVTRGVYSKRALKERFLKVRTLATRLAQVSDGGAPAFLLLLSFVQSFFIFKKGDPIPVEELGNEPVDTTDFTTYDILQRAAYWLERDDLELTIRYLNLLQGAPKSIAKDWIEEAITLLETEQAAETLLAHANSSL